MNCHMPHTTWGLFTAMRSHRIDSPSAAVSVATGRPNACNQCHLDRPLQWTADKLTEWYGAERVEAPKEHREVAASVVWALSGDAAQRAIAAWTLGWDEAQRASGSGWQGLILSALLADPYAAVRRVAFDALRKTPGFAGFEFDFVRPAEQQTPHASAAMSRWSAARSSHLDRRGPAVLIDTKTGEPDRSGLTELMTRRDDTPIRIIE